MLFDQVWSTFEDAPTNQQLVGYATAAHGPVFHRTTVRYLAHAEPACWEVRYWVLDPIYQHPHYIEERRYEKLPGVKFYLIAATPTTHLDWRLEPLPDNGPPRLFDLFYCQRNTLNEPYPIARGFRRDHLSVVLRFAEKAGYRRVDSATYVRYPDDTNAEMEYIIIKEST